MTLEETPTKLPPVSVVMPVHNGRPFIDESIQSILDQRFSDFEFVILDDASTDGSGERLRERQPSIEPSRKSEASRYLARSKTDEGRALNACFFSGIYRAVLLSYRLPAGAWMGWDTGGAGSMARRLSHAQIS